jgi:3-deoxy-7-phosphoheptulonate synthase/chorismate mutase
MGEDRLKELRSELDRINSELLVLLNQRADVVERLGRLKHARGVPAFDPEREREQLDMLVRENQGPFADDVIRHLFKQIFQRRGGVRHLGPGPLHGSGANLGAHHDRRPPGVAP